MARQKRFHHLAQIVHLLDELGEERFQVLVDSANTGKLKTLCEQLLMEGPLPGRMKLGAKDYAIVDPLLEEEKEKMLAIPISEIVRRVKETNIALKGEAAQRLLEKQENIPIACRRTDIIFVFFVQNKIGDDDFQYRLRRVFWCNGEKYWGNDSTWASDWDSRYRLIREI